MDSKIMDMIRTRGFGCMRESYGGSNARVPWKRALKSDWETLPMPPEHAEIELGIPISEDELEVLALGCIPTEMEDRWFVCFDGESICFYRSWTGFCIFKVHVRRVEQGYVLSSVTANRNADQYRETSEERDRIQAVILLSQALGHIVPELSEERSKIEGKPAHGGPVGTPLGFWHEWEAMGCCSNWHETGFELFGIHFATSEHWMMWEKARAMGDYDSAAEILSAPSPARAKELGGKVKPFHGGLWDAVREQLVYVGVREKFLQNEDIARKLLYTGSRVLAEASPEDHVWGVGIAADDPGFADFSGWKGDNLQGRVCMRVRDDLRLLYVNGAEVEARGTSEHDLREVIESPLGKMPLLALTRNPVTRDAVMCYARLARSSMHGSYPSLHAFLQDRGRLLLCDIVGASGSGQNGGMPPAGYLELLVQLAFLKRVGRL